MTTMNKMYTTLEQKEVDSESRTIVAWGSRPVQDRDKELIDSNAWDLKNFQKNPVLMLSHDYRLPPIGRVVWIKATKEGLRFKAEFAKTQMAEEIWSLYRDGFMKSFSVGFIPLKWEDPDEETKDGTRRIYKKAELLEISCVSVPSCPDALLEAYNNGTIKTKEFRSFIEDQLKQIELVKGENDGNEEQTKSEEQAEETKVEGSDCCDGEKGEVEFDLDLITKPDTVNYVHIPAKGQEGKHSGHKIRTITISASRGIKAHYCIPDKTITGYLFDQSKWTHDEAAQWVKDHSKIFEYDIQRLAEILSDTELDSYEYTEETYSTLISEKVEDEDKFCECEEPDFVEDECRGCGGRRKPRKPKKEFIEEIEDIGFGEVMHDEPNPLEIKMSDESEFVNDLFGVIELLSSRVQNLEIRLREVSVKAETKEFEVEEKAGRILSKKTRETIQRAIDALNELITLADKPKDDDEEDDDEDEKKDLILEDIELAEGDKIDSVVKEVLSDIFTTYDIDVKDFVDEAMKKMKGKMF